MSAVKPLRAIATLLAMSTPLLADPITFESGANSATLLELFTSEGCSSCPPADAWISTLKASPDLWQRVVPVVFHVDYWNGLGWPDRFATAAYTARQRRYAAAWKSDTVYTPGFVLDGREWRDWSRRVVPETAAGKSGRLQVTVDGPRAEVTYVPVNNSSAPLHVEFALLGTDLESDVKRGENSGRKLRHDFTALYFSSQPLRVVNGTTLGASLTLPGKSPGSPTAIAAWITAGDGQPPLQVLGGWLHRR